MSTHPDSDTGWSRHREMVIYGDSCGVTMLEDVDQKYCEWEKILWRHHMLSRARGRGVLYCDATIS